MAVFKWYVLGLLSIFTFHLLAEEVVVDKRFGKLTVYKPDSFPVSGANSLVLFISGDGGWQYGVVNMARFLAKQGALVVGIDAKSYYEYLKKQQSGCLYPAADFEQLSLFLQRKYLFQNYQKPILVGYSYGAALVYGLLAQAPTGTFAGGIALGFCPDIELPLPLCKGSGLSMETLKPKKLYFLNKVNHLPEPFLVLNGVKDQTCDYSATVEFLKDIGNAKMITLPKVGHGFSIADNWLPQLKSAFMEVFNKSRQINIVFNRSVVEVQTDLPLKVIEATNRTSGNLLFLISGDGGWTSFDEGLAQAFSANSVTVVGLDAQKYFWNKKSPDEVSKEIDRILMSYLRKYPELRITLMGYSFGACVVPFIANRLSKLTSLAMKNIVLLSPDQYGDFEIHVADMLSLGNKKQPYDVVKELAKIKSIPKLSIFAIDEEVQERNAFAEAGCMIRVLPGGHHFNNDFNAIINQVFHLDK